MGDSDKARRVVDGKLEQRICEEFVTEVQDNERATGRFGGTVRSFGKALISVSMQVIQGQKHQIIIVVN